jgi:hypothetical protein
MRCSAKNSFTSEQSTLSRRRAGTTC